MEPWAWSEKDAIKREIRQAFTGGPLDLASFPAMDSAAWSRMLEGRPVKEIEFARILDEPYYVVRTSPDEKALVGWPDGGHQPYFVARDPDAAHLVVAANSLKVHPKPFSSEIIVSRLREANPGVPIFETALLTEYDSYYYSRDGQAPPAGSPRQVWGSRQDLGLR
jgi:hypothetical protein